MAPIPILSSRLITRLPTPVISEAVRHPPSDICSGTPTTAGSEAQPDFLETSSMTVDEPIIERAAARSIQRLVSKITVASALCMYQQAT